MSVNNLIEKFSEIDQTFEDVTNDITTIIDENITNINEQLDTINSDIDGINSDLETVNTELGKINQDIIDTNTKIDNINSGLNTNKLDKITTAGTERVYSINTDGTQSTKTISNTATQDTLPIYGTSGTLNVGTPTETTHATTKTYVDAAITNLQTQVDETITERLEPLEEITSILKTDGDGANYLSDDGTYKEVVTVTSDDQTIVTSEDKVLTAVGLYDSTTDHFKSANELFLGTTMILFEEGEVV
jgi:predicted  nucleic acid-binding Zn-ribbon protein